MTKHAPSSLATYLYLHGISVPRAVQLSEAVELSPVNNSPSPELAIRLGRNPDETAILLLFLPRVTSELKIVAPDGESLARQAWNSMWDGILLGAIFKAQIQFNIQSECSVENLTEKSIVSATNYYVHGLRAKIKELSEEECTWIEDHYPKARELLKSDIFNSAVHCLASYRWHPHPRAQLALIWAGIEGLFKINSELSFRLSLYIAKFLEPSNRGAAKKSFDEIKKLYSSRSVAVHGGSLKDKDKKVVDRSALLLQQLICQCVTTGALPDVDALTI